MVNPDKKAESDKKAKPVEEDPDALEWDSEEYAEFLENSPEDIELEVEVLVRTDE